MVHPCVNFVQKRLFITPVCSLKNVSDLPLAELSRFFFCNAFFCNAFFKRVHRTSVEKSTVQLRLLGSEGRAQGDLLAPFEVKLDPIFQQKI